MNPEIMKSAGFEEELKNVNLDLCPFCRIKVNPEDFQDELSKKEYFISGLCQSCQDKMFGI